MMHMAWCIGYDVLDDVQCMMYNDSAHGNAHAAMQVSNLEGYASTHYFCWPESEPKSTQYLGYGK